MAELRKDQILEVSFSIAHKVFEFFRGIEPFALLGKFSKLPSPRPVRWLSCFDHIVALFAQHPCERVALRGFARTIDSFEDKKATGKILDIQKTGGRIKRIGKGCGRRFGRGCGRRSSRRYGGHAGCLATSLFADTLDLIDAVVDVEDVGEIDLFALCAACGDFEIA